MADSIPAEGLAGRITAIIEGLQDLSKLLEALPQQEEKKASAMRASVEPPKEISGKVAALDKPLPTPPSTPPPAKKKSSSAPHPSVKLIKEAKAACENNKFAEAADLLNSAQSSLRTTADRTLETDVMTCRKELRAKVTSAVKTLIAGGRFDVAIGKVQELKGLLNDVELEGLFLGIAEAQLKPLKENIPVVKKT
ncbi:MAG: hypothetical protein KR126chlam3_00776 [Chlamydiae bacterium]|nr:hypothetical protein [Chlamydiota bacterium]